MGDPVKRSEAKRTPKVPTADQAARTVSTEVVQQAPAQQAAAARRATPFAGPLPAIRPGLDRIVERVFDFPDPAGEFERLRAGLRCNPLTPGEIETQLNDAETNALTAHQLYVVFRADLERLEAENAAIMGAMREAALATLQAEKDQGDRKKAITEGDILAAVAQGFPDEYSALQESAIKARKTNEHCERLADLWKFRSKSLQSLNNKD